MASSVHVMSGNRIAFSFQMAVIFCLCLLAAVPALAATKGGKAGNKLSPRLQALSAPSFTAMTSTEQASALGLPEGVTALLRGAKGSYLAYVRVVDTGAATLDALVGAGATIVHVAPAYSVVTVAAAPASFSALAGLSQVLAVQEALRPMTGVQRTVPASGRTPSGVSAPLDVTCPWGSVRSEAWTQLKADQANAAFGVTGAGITVGVLSDSFDTSTSAVTHATDDVLTGDLPGPGNPCGYAAAVNVLSEYPGGSDEGRGMIQLVHDLAPAADIAFASAFNGLYDFADKIRALRAAGSDIIVDDVSYFEEPFFQGGPVDLAIKDVVADGGHYFTSAGNSNHDLNGQSVSGVEAHLYRPTTCPAWAPANATYYADCHDFDPGAGSDPTYTFTIAAGGTVIIDAQWSDNWNDVQNDFDIILFNDSGASITASMQYNIEIGRPFEIVGVSNNGATPVNLHMVIPRYVGSDLPFIGNGEVSMKHVLFRSSGLTAVEYTPANSSDIFGQTIVGHSGAEHAFSVAAVPYNDAQTPEWFTSHGPVTRFFTPSNGTSIAETLLLHQTLSKPDFAATDGGATTFFAEQDGQGVWRFYGTSAAAPHAAAVAALMLEQANAQGIPLNDAKLSRILHTTAGTIAAGSAASTGRGLVNALAAVNAAGRVGGTGMNSQMLLLLGD